MRRLSPRRRGEPGFTLIELLVVITILGILSAVVVFAVKGVGDKGTQASYRQDERTMRTAEEVFRGKNGVYGSESELVTAGLLQAQSTIHDVVLSPDKTSYLLPFQAQTGVAGGTLVVGETFNFPTNSSASNALTYNPATDTSGSTHAFWEIMYNGLLTIDEHGNPQPELATEVPTVANGGIQQGGKVYVLKLRNDVFWHDSTAGTPQQFTSADVKFSFEKSLLRFHARTRNMGALLNPPYDATSSVASAIAPCTNAENPGGDPNFCIAFHFTDPYAPLLRQLNVTEAAMIPSHLYTGTPSLTQLIANTVGTGPFKCYNPGSTPPCRDGTEGRVDKNASYWRTGFPLLDSIRMRVITDNNTRTNALIDGSVDWIWDVLETRAAEVQARNDLRAAPTQSLGGGPNSIDQLVFNLWDQGATAATINAGTAAPHPIFGGTDLIDPDGLAGPEPSQTRGLLVRRAFSSAVNRSAYLATRGNVGTVATAAISSELSAHATDTPLPSNDVAKAGQLLEAAGWKDLSGTYRVCQGCGSAALEGQSLDVTFVCGSATLCGRVDTVSSQLLLAKIHVVKVDCSSATTCGATSANVRVYTNRDFDMYILNLAQGYDPHVGVRRQFHSDQITDASAASVPNNTPGYKNTVVDAAFDNAAKTLDADARKAYYHQVQVQVAKDLPYVWVIETPNVRGYTAKCSGLREWTGLFAEFASCRR